MVWERKKNIIPDPPKPLLIKSWFLAAIFSIVFSILLFVLHASEKLYFLQQINIWVITSVPIVFWVISLCLCSFLYGRALNENQFLNAESQNAQKQWQNWAARYIAVIAHTVLLPDKITSSFIANVPKNFPPQYSLTRRICYLPDQDEISVLLQSIAPALEVLPPELKLNITLLTDATEKIQQQQLQAFAASWRSLLKERPAPENINVRTSLSYGTLDDRLKEGGESADLLVILQQHGKEKYSDGLGIFLLTTDDVAQKYLLSLKGRLLRPMTTEAKSIQPDLSLFMETQVLSQKALGLIGDSVELTNLTSQLLPVAETFGTPLTTDTILVQERFTGIPGPSSAWLTAGLGLDLALHYSSPYLVFARTEQHWFISTVLSGSHNEIVQ
ncbi:hypothetical protein [Rahnella contaminans]|uniref:hypothetical protein n=1 Tax=Rahnella contaminans TaxID=2703882 RepID=UPI0023DCB295|nr:hypothetical protein [Rahnella contaminans]MDF1897148.1 hypothetical protein [Rahnella contaminans]